MDEDSKGQRKMEDSGRGLLPAVEGLPRIEYKKIRRIPHPSSFSSRNQLLHDAAEISCYMMQHAVRYKCTERRPE